MKPKIKDTVANIKKNDDYEPEEIDEVELTEAQLQEIELAKEDEQIKQNAKAAHKELNQV